ncbi:MAG: hypothetical protein IPK61_05605 [Saprospiraceae bacterium]|nr:hypothetical protein [Saprospiraceae bacterium]
MNTRLDASINAKNGYKQVDARLLSDITVKNLDAQVVKYVFTYNFASAKFHKTLLQKITEFGANGTEFYSHEFSYYDDIPTCKLFEDPVIVNVPWTWILVAR